MHQAIRIGLLPLAAIVLLTGCGPANDNGGEASNRIRLDATKADAAFGDYIVHVSGLLTSDLTPEVAQSYGIVRSETRGFVNLVLLQKDASAGTEKPVKAKVTLSAANLTGQLKTTEVQEVVSGDSIYYIAEVDVTDREIINFDFDVRPADSNRLLQVRFTHEFYAR
jgi:hypothetical protein